MKAEIEAKRELRLEVELFGYDLISIMEGPTMQAIGYNKLWAYGNHFRTATYDVGLTTCDSLMKMDYWVECISHKKDKNPITANLPYVGIIDQILEVQYGLATPILLKVVWFNTPMNLKRTGMKKDNTGMFMVDGRSKKPSHMPQDEPYVLVTNKLEQVFLHDVPNSHWKLVVGASARSKHVVYGEK